MTTDTISCDMCQRAIQPKRRNKDGLHYCGNACRQKAHRQKTAKNKPTATFSSGVTLYPSHVLDDPDEWKRIVFMLKIDSEAAKAKKPSSRLLMIEASLSGVIGQRNNLAAKVERLEAELTSEKERRQASYERESRTSDGLHAFAKETHAKIRALLDLAEDLKNRGTGGLTQEEWQRLRDFDDTQLRNWVKVGATMDRRGHTGPMLNAVRWVEGNAPQLPGPKDGGA